MDRKEQKELHDECWKVIGKVNTIIEGLEKNKKSRQNADIDELLNALINVNKQVIELGKHFGVSV